MRRTLYKLYIMSVLFINNKASINVAYNQKQINKLWYTKKAYTAIGLYNISCVN